MPPSKKDFSSSRCVVPGCTSVCLQVGSHCFPKDVELSKAWVEAIRSPMLRDIDSSVLNKNYHVCKLHFSAADYVPRTTKATLRKNVVPSLHLPTDSNLNVAASATAVTDEERAVSSSDTDNVNVSDVSAAASASAGAHEQRDEPSTISSVPIDEPSTSGPPAKKPRTRLVLRVADLSPRSFQFQRKARSFQAKALMYQKRALSFKKKLQLATEFSEEQSFSFFAHRLTRKQMVFFRMQARVNNCASGGRRFTSEEKMLALSLLKSSGRGYRLLSQIFQLPSVRTLQRMLSKMNVDTGLNATVLKHLRNAVRKFSDERDKLVSLVWDEMKLQAQLHHDVKADKIVGFEDWGSGRTSVFADHALVFMIRGIKRNWKIPLSFTFCSAQTKTDRLSHLIKRHIAALKSVGLIVVATICDRGSANVAAINALKGDTRRLLLQSGRNANVDQMIIHGMTITPLYDVPHLLKTLRNNLLLKHLEFRQQEEDGHRHFAKWDHLQIMYLLDLNLDTDLRGLWKIGQYHIVPKSIKKMKVKYAAQVFSRTMSSHMALAANHECVTPAGVKMPKDALDTSRFLLFVDKLFDSLNGGAGEKRPTALRRTVSKSTGHRRFWIEAVQFLRNSTFVDKYTLRRASRSNSCLGHWIQTVQGFMHLWSRLLQKEGFVYFSPRNLNQDALENFFGAIRSHGWRNVMPSCTQFIGAYKSLLINNLTSYHSLSANCENDEGEMLINFAHTLEEGGDDHSSDRDSIQSDALPFAPQVYAPTARTVMSRAALAYTAGYVARRLLKSVKNCSECRSNVLAVSPNPDLHCNLQNREYNSDISALHYVSKDFLDSFVRCDQILREFLPSECFVRNVSKRMQVRLDEEALDWLTCVEHASVAKLNFKKFTVSLQIHAFCTNVNNILSGKEIRYSNGTNRIFRQAIMYRSTHCKHTL